jgi:hypothetical protein
VVGCIMSNEENLLERKSFSPFALKFIINEEKFDHQTIFFEKHSTHPYEHTRTSYPYEHLRKTELILILRFMKSVTKSALLSTGTLSPTESIISRKCNTHVKSEI